MTNRSLFWQAGSAETTFPIATSTPLGGYMARTSGATGTLDPLMIGALHLRTGERSLTIVTADVIGVDSHLRDRIAIAAGIAPETLLINASHTHSGPKRIVCRLHPIDANDGDRKLRARFVQLAAETILRAQGNTEQVSLWIGETDASGAWSNRTAIDQPSDPRLRLLVTKRPNGSIQTAIAIVPCHPTVLGAESAVVSADLTGGIRRAIAASPAFEGPVVLSLAGAAGDISTRFVRQEPTPAEIERLATLATTHLDAALDNLHEVVATDTSLQSHQTKILLPSFRDDCSSDPHADMLSARAAMEQAQSEGASPPALRQAITRYQGAILRHEMASSPNLVDPTPIAVVAWSLSSDLALVATPVEIFSSLGMRVEGGSSFTRTLVLGYTNGYAGYVADTAAWDAGTYEALASPFARRAGDVLVDEATALLADLHRDAHRQAPHSR